MAMPSVENSSQSVDGKMNTGKDEQQQAGKRISRVSKLRDMFQNGIIRPIEEIDNVVPFEENLPDCDRHPDAPRLPRSFPGSPPLSALRAHRKNWVANNNSSPGSNDPSRSRSPASSPRQNPPICPPKPRHLVIDKPFTKHAPQKKSSPAPSSSVAPATDSNNKDHCLKTCIQRFENGCSKTTTGQLQNGAAPAAPVRTAYTRVVLKPAGLDSKPQAAADVAAPPREVTASATITPTTVAATSPAGARPLPTLPGDSSPTAAEIPGKADSLRDSLPQETSDQNSSAYSTPIGQLGSWKGSDVDSRGDCQQVVLQPNDFQSSGGTPLQHAESVAVATPDEEDEEKGFPPPGEDEKPGDEGETEYVVVPANGSPVQPTLPVPTGLHVVAIDSNGVHILEDGNFFYAYRRPYDDADGDFLSTGAPAEKENGGDLDNNSRRAGLQLSDDPDDECDAESRHRVRFSSAPVLAYSTYSVSEYNRRNEDIDPLGASAEYELEKQLEHMEMVTVDLKKGPQGLGFSILGLGVDRFGADQKLGIFIKMLTPGGAAETDGRIRIFDQIVEVDGISLVGVTSEFAATTLRSTKDIVHFVVAREKDPYNSRVAKLLRQQEEMQELLDGDHHYDSEDMEDDEEDEDEKDNNGEKEGDRNGRDPEDRFNNDPGTSDSFLHREDSYETLHRLTAGDEDKAAGTDGALTRPLEFTANPLFDQSPSRPSEFSLKCPLGTPPTTLVSPPALANSSPTSVGVSPPRSALKGTATAASTQRRGEAISQLIGQATQEVKQSFPSDNPIDMADRVAWYLASNLHECQIALAKQRGQLRGMEQRLTAQEAAADEAIERLCLQCRHAESELKRVSDQLRLQQDQCLLLANRQTPVSPKKGHREELQQGSPMSRSSVSYQDSYYRRTEDNGEAVPSVPVDDKPVEPLTSTTAETEQNGPTHSSKDNAQTLV